MAELYIISGCNGAGKTTASYTILPEILNCHEFVNADNIAAGISPFNPEGVAIESARIMLARIGELLELNVDFALETTLATRSYASLIRKAQSRGYNVTLLYFWLNSPEVAIERVAKRVAEGGHNIPEETIIRRYYRGIRNFFSIYKSICDRWVVIDNMGLRPIVIAKGNFRFENFVFDQKAWERIKQLK
jgi:predicted ABC-type ATPase